MLQKIVVGKVDDEETDPFTLDAFIARFTFQPGLTISAYLVLLQQNVVGKVHDKETDPITLDASLARFTFQPGLIRCRSYICVVML